MDCCGDDTTLAIDENEGIDPKVIDAVRTILEAIDDDPSREGLKETPRRVAKAYLELFRGYKESPEAILTKVFKEVGGYEDMVMVKDIPFTSHCEHHMVPFRGTASIAYYPNGGVVGLSKLARLVDCFANRLQTQETLTAQIAGAIEEHLKPHGVAVLLNAEHMCMSMRGVRKEGSSTTTQCFTGRFENAHEQNGFMMRLAK